MEPKREVLQEKLTGPHQQLYRRRRFQLRMLENWWVVGAFILGLYVGLPIVAPVLMKAGATAPANGIYSAYGYMCHQFAFRSLFLFGDQVIYPRESTGTNLKTFEEEAVRSDAFMAIYMENRRGEFGSNSFTPDELKEWSRALQMSARKFRGDEQMGYKIALCQRDIAIYLAMTGGAVVYGFVRKRLRPVPLWLYVLLGIAPIGLDGFSQLLGYPPFNFWEPRETQPFFRILTGALFGFMNIWLAFPYIELTMRASARRARADLEAIEVKIEALVEKAKSALQ
jgi:uncharacterized membrane protein